MCSVWTSHSALWGESLLFCIPSGEGESCLRSCPFLHLTLFQDECIWGWGETIASSNVQPFDLSLDAALDMWPLFCSIMKLISAELRSFFHLLQDILLLVLCPGYLSFMSINAGGAPEWPLCDTSGTNSSSYLEEMNLGQNQFKMLRNVIYWDYQVFNMWFEIDVSVKQSVLHFWCYILENACSQSMMKLYCKNNCRWQDLFCSVRPAAQMHLFNVHIVAGSNLQSACGLSCCNPL